MELTLVNPHAHVGCREVRSVVTVATLDGAVVTVRRDGAHAPEVSRRDAADPDSSARQICADLAADGYAAA